MPEKSCVTSTRIECLEVDACVAEDAKPVRDHPAEDPVELFMVVHDDNGVIALEQFQQPAVGVDPDLASRPPVSQK